MQRFIWLASYPKSGNTWMRVFFTNLRLDAAAPAHINRLLPIAHASDRSLFDEAVGFASGDLTHDEVDALRRDVYLYYARRGRGHLFCKVHDAFTVYPDARPMFPPEATAGVIYLVRNPLDVCVSLAHFVGAPRDEVIGNMADPGAELAGPTDHLEAGQLRQRLRTWSDHVRSWADAPNVRVLVLRYEDMKTRPVETFTAAAAFVGMTQDRDKVERALRFSSIEELQRQERAEGFRGAAAPGRAFFRKGKVGSWREELTESQVARIIRDHRDVMRRFGYLTEAGEPAA
ncbi:MAG TPA: sulfotransferase domain-containing protein [Gemmataceae bacterium]|nr:sulfotransferase domain-containing protein [Gemmataceae bacterium]